MNEYFKLGATVAMTALVTAIIFFIQKGFRADIADQIEKKQKERHEQNTSKLELLTTSVNSATTALATQTEAISGLRMIQAAHDRSQRDALHAQGEAFKSLELRVIAIEDFIREFNYKK